MIAELRLHEQITPVSQGDMGREAQEIHEHVEHAPGLQQLKVIKLMGHTVILCPNVPSAHSNSRLLGVAPNQDLERG